MTTSIYQGLKVVSTRCSTTISIDTLSVEVYEIQFFRADFTPICEYVFRLSFLTTLNIYKDCFKGHYSWCTSMQKFFSSSHNEDHEVPWLQNPTVYKHNNFFKRKMNWCKICLQSQFAWTQLCFTFAQPLTALKTILIYV